MSKKNIAGIFLLILIFAAGIFVRFDNLAGHFTHIDDLLVATSLMSKGRLENIHQDLQTGVPAKGKEYENSGLYKTLSSQKDSPVLYSITYHFLKFRSRFWRISKSSTYAPLQCGIISWIVDVDESGGYESIKFKGRFVSCMMGILSIAGMAFLVFSFYREHPYVMWLSVLAGSLVAFSWENIVYSQQMEPYSIVVFFHCILLWTLFRYGSIASSAKHFLWLGVLAGFLAWGQYQLLFAGVAFILTLLVVHQQPRKLYWKYGLLLLGFAATVFPLLSELKGRSSGGVNWNAGDQGQFLLTSIYRADLSLLEIVGRTIQFFIENTYLTIRSMIGFVPDEQSLLLAVFTGLFIALMSVGIYSLIVSRKTDNKKKILLVYVLCLSITWIGLLVLGKITLSPTRHSMMLIPVFILPAIEGVCFIFRKYPAYIIAGISALVIVQVSAFWVTYSKEKNIRTDIVSEASLQSIIEQFDPEFIVSYAFTDNIPLMQFANTVPHVEMNSPSSELQEYQSQPAYYAQKYASVFGKNPRRIMLFSTRSSWDTTYIPAMNVLLGLQLENYRVLKKSEIRSDREIEYSKLTQNGRNELFCYILER